MAREGYINLHLAQHKRSKTPGDSDQMMKSRQRFLNAGYYQCLAESVAELIKQESICAVKTLLDIGCGEGYYLQYLSQIKTIENLNLIGIDISKSGVKLAAKRHIDAQLIVDSAYNLPLFNTSIDVVLSIFSPLCPKETARVLKPGGVLIMVGPGEQHLSGLTTHIYDQHQPHQGNFKLIDEQGLFALKKSTNLQQNISVKKTDIENLLTMTPYYWHTSPEQKKLLSSLPVLITPIEFHLRVYEKISS